MGLQSSISLSVSGANGVEADDRRSRGPHWSIETITLPSMVGACRAPRRLASLAC